jgi:hypothetical protein
VVLIKEAIVEAIKDGKMTKAFLREILKKYIVKERDREFLGLASKS